MKNIDLKIEITITDDSGLSENASKVNRHIRELIKKEIIFPGPQLPPTYTVTIKNGDDRDILLLIEAGYQVNKVHNVVV
ncbi:MAG: hypothetical protein WC575_00855 [Patescibacteria group bacterium]